MAEFVVFDDLKKRISITEVLRHYGILDSLRSRKGGDELAGKCPMQHSSSSSDPFRVSVSKNAFHCWSCGAQGNVIGLVQAIEELSTRDAAILLQRWFPGAPGGSQSRPEPVQEISSEPVEINPPLQAPAFPLKNLNPQHPYLAERGLNLETVEKFGLGSASRGILKGRIGIPLHREDGALVAYAGRWIGEGEPPEGEPRYRLPGGFVKTAVLFNLHRARELAREKGELIVTEGYFTVFRLFQCGIENAVATMGAHLSERQRELLVETLGPQGRVVLLFDDDEAGLAGSSKAAEALMDQLFVKVVKLPDGAIQPDELDDEELRRIVAA